MTQVPLIWTSEGNLPIDSLTHSTNWEIVPQEYIKLTETYKLDGRVVKESAHIYSLKSFITEAAGASLS